jgi:ribonuclease HI
MAKAYRTTSSEALCVLTGMTPIIIKLEELAQRCKAKERTGNLKIELDHEVEFKNWQHPADAVTIEEVVSEEDATISAYTDGSKQDQAVGFGVAIFKGSNMVAKAQLKLDTRCSNNQAEQFAILKALETLESLNNKAINPRTATIFTDSRVSLDSLLNPKNHAFLVEKIRRKVASLENNEWKIKFSWG